MFRNFPVPFRPHWQYDQPRAALLGFSNADSLHGDERRDI
jgi:hypothetical protein